MLSIKTNTFHELTCPVEQHSRFTQDNSKRSLAGDDEVPHDPYLLGALSSGLPSCAGVALGVDRLLMLALNKQELSEVLSFSIANA